MSGTATFSSPTTATGGLQGYDLERKVKNLAPATGVLFRNRLRQRLAARRKASTGPTMKKDHRSMNDTIKSMLDTLSKSVTDIVAAGTADQPELLNKSFGEFGTELDRAILAHLEGELAKRDPSEDDLFKGLGTVGRVANLVGMLADRIGCIKDGQDYKGQEEGNDEPSEEVCALLDDCLQSAELAMRSAVNEHVDVAEDGDVEEPAEEAGETGESGGGQRILILKSADAPEDPEKGIRVKTRLPEELAKFATDPAFLDQALLDRAAGTLMAFGVKEQALAKLLGGGTLAKAFGDPEAEAGNVADPNVADPNDPEADQTDSQDPMEQLHVLGRLLAASLIQLDSFMRAVEGDAGGDPNADPNAQDANAEQTEPNAEQTDPGGAVGEAARGGPSDQGGGAAEEEDPTKKKNPFGKSADFIALEGQVADLSQKLAKVLGTPLDPKAVLVSGGGRGALAKIDDSVMNDADARTPEELAKEIDEIADPAKRAEKLIKMDMDIKAGRLRVKAA